MKFFVSEEKLKKMVTDMVEEEVKCYMDRWFDRDLKEKISDEFDNRKNDIKKYSKAYDKMSTEARREGYDKVESLVENRLDDIVNRSVKGVENALLVELTRRAVDMNMPRNIYEGQE